MCGRWIMKNKLAIFDLDGTLFDTTEVNYRAYDRALHEYGYNLGLDYRYYCDFCHGNSYKAFLPQLIPGITLKEREAIHEYKQIIYPEFLGFASKNQQLFSLIECIRTAYVIAIATTASRKNAHEILQTYQVTDLFDIIVAQEDVEKYKPDPECFLLVMKMAQLRPEQALIFEDSDQGIAAAKASGAACVRVFNNF